MATNRSQSYTNNLKGKHSSRRPPKVTKDAFQSQSDASQGLPNIRINNQHKSGSRRQSAARKDDITSDLVVVGEFAADGRDSQGAMTPEAISDDDN